MLLKVLKYSSQQRASGKLSPIDLKELQLKKFRDLVAFINIHSPYYQQIIKQHNIDITSCRPEDFPILTKTDVINNFDQIVTDKRITQKALSAFLHTSTSPQDLFLNQYYVLHTSGSSGQIGYYIYNQNEWAQGIAASSRATGVSFGHSLAYVGATKGHFAGVSIVCTAKRLPFLYKHVEILDINQPFEDIIKRLNALQPSMLSGYATALKKLAEAQETGTLTIKPISIQSGGEPLISNDREYIHKVFGAPVINVYASSEHLYMGIGKKEFQGMYLMEDNLYFEIYDYTLVTNLFNYTLPLIRYQMNDILVRQDDTNQVLPFTKIKDVIGRNEYLPIFLNDKGVEDFIHPLIFVEFFVENLDKFQIVLKTKSSFTFKAVFNHEITIQQKELALKEINQKLHTILTEKQMFSVKFKIEEVEMLWVNPKSSKFKLITQAT